MCRGESSPVWWLYIKLTETFSLIFSIIAFDWATNNQRKTEIKHTTRKLSVQEHKQYQSGKKSIRIRPESYLVLTKNAEEVVSISVLLSPVTVIR